MCDVLSFLETNRLDGIESGFVVSLLRVLTTFHALVAQRDVVSPLSDEIATRT